MSFLRLSAPEGARFDPAEMQEPNKLLLRIALGNVGLLHQLEPGEYDLTPEIWTHNAYTHNLLVHSQHEATYRMLPVAPDSTAYELTSQRALEGQQGGRVIKVPTQQPAVVIAGGHPDGDIRIFEAVLFAPEA